MVFSVEYRMLIYTRAFNFQCVDINGWVAGSKSNHSSYYLVF